MSAINGPQGPSVSVLPRDIRSVLPDSGRLPRVGKLRLGIKKTSSNSGRAVEYPSAVDYFVVNEDGATSRQAADSFHAIYGDEPRELDVTLPGATVADNLEGAWRSYGTGGLLKRRCSGPGGECVVRGAEGVWVPGPCACQAEGIDPSDKKNHCQERFTFTVMLMRVQGVGVWQADTGSRMAAEGLAASLRMIESFRGHLQGAEALLRIVPRQVSPGGVAKTVYIMELGSASLTPAQALELGSSTNQAKRVELPASTLDEAPDELLDHEVLVEHTPEGISRDVDPLPVAQQVKALNAFKRGELYRLAEIPRGSKADVVRGLVCAAWDKAGLPPFQNEPDLEELLHEMQAIERAATPGDAAEAFQVFADTGQDIDPGTQVPMYGEGAPS